MIGSNASQELRIFFVFNSLNSSMLAYTCTLKARVDDQRLITFKMHKGLKSFNFQQLKLIIACGMN